MMFLLFPHLSPPFDLLLSRPSSFCLFSASEGRRCSQSARWDDWCTSLSHRASSFSFHHCCCTCLLSTVSKRKKVHAAQGDHRMLLSKHKQSTERERKLFWISLQWAAPLWLSLSILSYFCFSFLSHPFLLPSFCWFCLHCIWIALFHLSLLFLHSPLFFSLDCGSSIVGILLRLLSHLDLLLLLLRPILYSQWWRAPLLHCWLSSPLLALFLLVMLRDLFLRMAWMTSWLWKMMNPLMSLRKRLLFTFIKKVRPGRRMERMVVTMRMHDRSALAFVALVLGILHM